MNGRKKPAALSEQPPRDDLPEQLPATAPTQHEEPRFDLRGWLFAFAQRTFVLLSLYVLSIGPMYWQWYGGRFSEGSQLVAAFYEPLFILASVVPWFGRWMDWYVGLWI